MDTFLLAMAGTTARNRNASKMDSRHRRGIKADILLAVFMTGFKHQEERNVVRAH